MALIDTSELYLPPPTPDTITGLILAGGRASRLGGQDKGLMDFRGQPLVAWVIAALRHQVGSVLINANRNLAAYAKYGFPVIPDLMEGFQGPLAGIAAGMAIAKTPWLLTLPCDGPFPPIDLVQRLIRSLSRARAEIAVAHDGERLQPVYALLALTLAPSLRDYLAAGNRRIDTWQALHRLALADFSDGKHCFFNLNTPQDHQKLERKSPSPGASTSP